MPNRRRILPKVWFLCPQKVVLRNATWQFCFNLLCARISILSHSDPDLQMETIMIIFERVQNPEEIYFVRGARTWIKATIITLARSCLSRRISAKVRRKPIVGWLLRRCVENYEFKRTSHCRLLPAASHLLQWITFFFHLYSNQEMKWWQEHCCAATVGVDNENLWVALICVDIKFEFTMHATKPEVSVDRIAVEKIYFKCSSDHHFLLLLLSGCWFDRNDKIAGRNRIKKTRKKI